MVEWVEHGCLAAAWALLLGRYDGEIGLQWEWQAADGCIVKAPLGKKGSAGEAEATGRNPTDRGKCGSKRHLLTDGAGVPLALVLSGANRTDMKKLEDLLEARLLPVPEGIAPHLCLDRGYDYAACRATATGPRLYAAHPAQGERGPAAAAAGASRPPPPAPLGGGGRAQLVQPLPAAADPVGQASGPLPGLRPTRRLPHHLSQAPPCPTTFWIGC